MSQAARDLGDKTFRVLSLDGGGMRGLYSATYLDRLAKGFAKNNGVEALDIGAGFDLIVGTSTGGILACALAAGVSLGKVIELYRSEGPNIFQSSIPEGVGVEFGRQLMMRRSELRAGSQALRLALSRALHEETLAEVYKRRGIALSVPAIEMNTHSAWVFKTPHLEGTNHRDDDYKLVDVCMATSAAPIFRSLEAIDFTNGYEGHHVFADGGLWANNPVLIALIDALRMTGGEGRIEIFCLGTCPKPTGESIAKADVHRGFVEWKMGGKVAELSIDAQEFAFDHMARMIKGYVSNDCEIMRFPSNDVPPDDAKYLNLDETSKAGMDTLTRLALRDADHANGLAQDQTRADGKMIKSLFSAMSPAPVPDFFGLAVEAKS